MGSHGQTAGPGGRRAGWAAAGGRATAVVKRKRLENADGRGPGAACRRPERGDSGAGRPVRRPVLGWILTKYVGYASYTRLHLD